MTSPQPKKVCRHCGHDVHGYECRSYLPQAILPMRCPCIVRSSGQPDPKALERLAELKRSAS